VSACFWALLSIGASVIDFSETPEVARLVDERGGGDAEALIAARHRQVPMGRMGDGWDVAHAVLFLASDQAKYITATELVVDGGLSATCVAPHPHAA
jgi:NAD(P)-dependent dehydrogenase (short-subunit alcohol dehydrogenase family)